LVIISPDDAQYFGAGSDAPAGGWMPQLEMEDQPFTLSRITPEQKSAGSTPLFEVTDLTQETQRSFRLRSSGESCAETQTEHATAKQSGRISAEAILITASPLLCTIAYNWLNGRSERRIVLILAPISIELF
jgi:hypothetical protein